MIKKEIYSEIRCDRLRKNKEYLLNNLSRAVREKIGGSKSFRFRGKE